jgi:hypothetical protein
MLGDVEADGFDNADGSNNVSQDDCLQESAELDNSDSEDDAEGRQAKKTLLAGATTHRNAAAHAVTGSHELESRPLDSNAIGGSDSSSPQGPQLAKGSGSKGSPKDPCHLKARYPVQTKHALLAYRVSSATLGCVTAGFLGAGDATIGSPGGISSSSARMRFSLWTHAVHEALSRTYPHYLKETASTP